MFSGLFRKSSGRLENRQLKFRYLVQTRYPSKPSEYISYYWILEESPVRSSHGEKSVRSLHRPAVCDDLKSRGQITSRPAHECNSCIDLFISQNAILHVFVETAPSWLLISKKDATLGTMPHVTKTSSSQRIEANTQCIVYNTIVIGRPFDRR